ncbi:MAG: PAS domain S-box protein, partial [Nitrospinota bacterium]|nr:PAS domain S-box protein [Nitrospinota bacterium]
MDSFQIGRLIDKEKADLLYNQYPAVLAGNVAIGLLVFLFLGGQEGGVFITLWFMALLALTALRAGIVMARNRHLEAFTPKTWIHVYIAMAASSGLLFGSLEFTHLLDYNLSLEGDLIIALMIAGMCSAAATTNSPSFMAVLAFMVPALGPLIYIHTMKAYDTANLSVGLAALAFLVLLLVVSRRLGKFVEESLRIRHEKTILLEELTEKGRLLQEAQRIAKLGSFEWRVQEDTSSQSEETLRILGLDHHAVGFGIRKFVEAAHPEDRAALAESIEKDFQERKPKATHEFRIKQPNGSIIFIRSEAEIEYGPSGEPIVVRGVNQDVTDMRLADARIKMQSAIMEHIAEGVQMTRVADSVIAHTNPKFDTMFGYEPGELMGRHVSILNYPGHDKTPVETAREIDSAILEKGEWQGEILNVRKDGSPFWTSATVTRYQDPEYGDVMLTVQKDITGARALREKLAESEEWHKTLFNNAPDAIFIIDAVTGVILDVNEAGLWLMDKHRDEIVGTHHFLIHPPEIQEAMRARFQARSTAGFGVAMETMILRGDGGLVPVEISSHKLHIGGKKVIQGIVRDVSDRKMAEDALKESQRALSALIGNLQGVAYRCKNDLDWPVEFISDGVESLTGRAPQEFMEQKITFGSLIHPDDAHKVWDKVQEALNSGTKFTVEYRISTAGGEERWVWEQGHGCYSATGELLALEGFITDITARKRAEEALAKSEHRFRTLLQSIDAAVVAHMPDTSIAAINHKALELLGITEDQAMGRMAFDPEWRFVDENGQPLALERYPVNQVLSSRQPFHDKILGIHRPDLHNLVWVLVSAFPVFDNGDIHEVIVTFMDISEQKKAAEQLKIAKETAEEATELKDKFVSMVAHDLKNPIGSIGGFLSYILSDPDNALSSDHQEILKRVINANELMVRTIDDLLDISRLKSGKIKPHPEFFEPRQIAWAVFGQTSMLAEAKMIILVNDIPERMRLFADKPLYFQALTNLTTNAIKFSHSGGRVRVYAQQPGATTLVVEDSGVGMSQAQMDSLYKSGGKNSTPGTAGERGTGLGL